MAWVHIALLTLLPTVVILTVLSEVESAAVKDGKVSQPEHTRHKASPPKVFLPESDASNFFKRRARRSPKSPEEYSAEQRVQSAASERRREYYEEQSNEYENHREEERDEQYERTREKMEQWRQYHYDGYYPRYPHHRAYA
ncbi:upper zone of growth plate and cartilage matrix associated a [Brachyhypopomus gauderio]|uniref:upper zone of growth plate and cartilage matrix associated a n=1 Tax=Brachyhypopomus gauderio TaxID=698409 RepID=UPI0040421575